MRDGRAVLGLPFGLKLVSRHIDYDPPHMFADELVRAPFRWRHVHRFEAVDGGTRMTDTVETSLPDTALRRAFAYRHRQVADDLAVHHDLAARHTGAVTVAVTGASGLVGSALCALLTTGGHRVLRLVRGAPRGDNERRWNPDDPGPDLFSGVDAVVHLAGASIAGRFTPAHKAAVRDSRVRPTRLLAEALAHAHPEGPHALVAASAIGLYGPQRGGELLAETAARGDGFLADLVADWEAAASPAETAGVRVVRVRTGIVQSPRGGTLRLLRPLFLAGAGGRIGDGTQWLSWIDLDDLTDIYLRAILDDRVAGPVNAVAPAPVRNAEYAATLARVLHRPSVVPTPPFGPRLVLGAEGAAEMALASQRVEPAELKRLGHRFRHPALEASLRHQLGRTTAS